MRYRTRETVTSPPSTLSWSWTEYRYENGNSYTVRHDEEDFDWGTKEVIETWDEPTPGFHKRSRAGEIINSPYTNIVRAEEVSFPTVTGVTIYGTTTIVSAGRRRQQHVDGSMRTLYLPGSMIDAARQQAYAGISIHDTNSILWLGEARECLKMFWEAGSKLVELLRSSKAARIRWAKGLMNRDELRQLYLQIQYGILPIEDSIKQMSDLFKTKKSQRYTSRGSRQGNQTRLDNIVEPFDNWEVDRQLTESLNWSIRAGYLYDLDLSGVSKVERLGLTPQNVTETAWALTRLSFVVDWFVSVGPTIAAWSPKVGCRLLAGWYTIEETWSCQIVDSHRGVTNNGETSQSMSGTGRASLKIKTKTRVPANDVPLLPVLDVSLNASKVLSLIALFTKWR